VQAVVSRAFFYRRTAADACGVFIHWGKFPPDLLAQQAAPFRSFDTPASVSCSVSDFA
jgi:hypothetical protein